MWQLRVQFKNFHTTRSDICSQTAPSRGGKRVSFPRARRSKKQHSKIFSPADAPRKNVLPGPRCTLDVPGRKQRWYRFKIDLSSILLSDCPEQTIQQPLLFMFQCRRFVAINVSLPQRANHLPNACNLINRWSTWRRGRTLEIDNMALRGVSGEGFAVSVWDIGERGACTQQRGPLSLVRGTPGRHVRTRG